MKLYQRVLFYILIISSITPFDVNALSCSRMKDRIIAQCKGYVCDEVILISEIRSFNGCQRRPKVIDITPKWAKLMVEYEINARGFADKGIYELNMISNAKYIQDYVESIENKEQPNSYFIKFRKLNDKSFQTLQEDWESTELKTYISHIFSKVFDVGTFTFQFVLLVFSIVWFNLWIDGKKTIKWLLLSLGTQLLIMSQFFLVIIGLYFYKYIFFGLIIPGVWFYQIVFFLTKNVSRNNS